MQLEQLFILGLISLLLIGLWKHLEVSQAARRLAAQYCEKQNLVLLDQSVILARVGVAKSKRQLFTIERHYRFEFSTIGDARYQGRIHYSGTRLERIELDAFRV